MTTHRNTFCLLVLMLLISLGAAAPGQAAPPLGPRARPDAVALANPILFVTQVPVRADFTTIGSTFGNHKADLASVARGGDLWIRYPDGSVKNLTAVAGYGSTDPTGFQGANAIAVRDPAVHWDGTKALFSMVIGGAAQQYQYNTYFWQLYEITGLGPNESPVITKVPHQPANRNNVQPIYGTDDRIIFTSDHPRSGEQHLYPQLDEYELAPTNTGLWSLNPGTGDLRLLNHAPSGDFTPTIDSFGRVIFTQWDHLQRDQQADADDFPGCNSGPYGTFTYASEAANAAILPANLEVFPEPRGCRSDLLGGTNLAGHTFNLFMPWQINEDGSDSEILNHLGRHELIDYIGRAITDDPNVIEYYEQYPRFNPNSISSLFQIKEDPTMPGRYFGVDAPEFATHASGQIVSLNAPPTTNADHVAVTYVTHRATLATVPSPNHSGRYREPLPLSDGTLVAVHAPHIGTESNTGGPNTSLYDFRLKTLALGGNGHWAASQPLTPGFTKTIRYWSPDVMVVYTGPLWELNPVEVRARPRPDRPRPRLAPPEQQILAQAGVSPIALRFYLARNNLALTVSRNVTSRDDLDKQQPYNLRVAGGGVQTIGSAGKLYDVSHLQFFQADQLRGWTGSSNTPRPGRRVLARALHDATAMQANIPLTGAPEGSVKLATDGSLAAFVPAGRALTWQLTDGAGTGIVRERYWLTFQAGEIRVCASCHGLSESNQAGQGSPNNPPQALLQLLEHWKTLPCTNRSPDLNADTRVDIRDIQQVGALYNVAAPASYDLNCDSSVNLTDVMLVVQNWQMN